MSIVTVLAEQIFGEIGGLGFPSRAQESMMCLAPVIVAMALAGAGAPAEAEPIADKVAMVGSNVTNHGSHETRFIQRRPRTMPRTHNDIIVPSPSAEDEARGRRILSTAFVMVGPDGHLSIKHHDGNVLILRDVTMGPTKYCGMQAVEGGRTRQYCGRYGEIAFARAGATAVMD